MKKKGKSASALQTEPLTARGDVHDIPHKGANAVSVLAFDIGGEPFAIGVENTEGVVDCPRLSPLPNSPEGIIGVGSVRGRMTIAVDLSLKPASRAAKQRLILVKGDAQIGLLADHVEGVVALAPRQLRKGDGPAAASQSGESNGRRWKATAYFKDAGRVVPIIDVDQLTET